MISPKNLAMGTQFFKRYPGWVKSGVVKRIFESVCADPGMEYVMVDATRTKVLRHARSGCKRGLEISLQVNPRAV